MRARERELLHRTVQRFRGGIVFKAHRLCVSLNSRMESNQKEEKKEGDLGIGARLHLGEHAGSILAWFGVWGLGPPKITIFTPSCLNANPPTRRLGVFLPLPRSSGPLSSEYARCPCSQPTRLRQS